jgi:glycosyltransferase involved in cell wall biosynthesis
MAKRPFFSIIVPTHKRARLLRRALASIMTQETSHSFETIVISDCVDAETSAVCDEMLRPQDLYIRRNGKPGPSQSRNLALRLARGDNILFLDDDDAFHAGALQHIASSATLSKGQPIYFNCSVVRERRLPDALEFLGETALDLRGMVTDEIYVKNRIPNSCIAFPAHCLSGILFDEHVRAYEDWDFVLAVLDQMPLTHEPILGVQIYQVDDETTDRRGSSAGATNFNAVLDYLHIYRRHPAPNDAIKTHAQSL